MKTLRLIGIGCEIRAIPDEIPDAIPFLDICYFSPSLLF
jgi:hypothetical protein